MQHRNEGQYGLVCDKSAQEKRSREENGIPLRTEKKSKDGLSTRAYSQKKKRPLQGEKKIERGAFSPYVPLQILFRIQSGLPSPGCEF